MNGYLKSFVIGASLPVMLPYLLGLLLLDDKYKNYPHKYFEAYVIIAPLYFGVLNVLSLYFAKQYDWTLKERMLYAGIFSGIFVTTLVRLLSVYNYDQFEWMIYHTRHVIAHILTFVIIMYLLEKYI